MFFPEPTSKRFWEIDNTCPRRFDWNIHCLQKLKLSLHWQDYWQRIKLPVRARRDQQRIALSPNLLLYNIMKLFTITRWIGFICQCCFIRWNARDSIGRHGRYGIHSRVYNQEQIPAATVSEFVLSFHEDHFLVELAAGIIFFADAVNVVVWRRYASNTDVTTWKLPAKLVCTDRLYLLFVFRSECSTI